MKKPITILVALWTIALLAAQPAQAILLTLVPSSATVSAGDTVDVDVVISGLGNGVPPSVGAFDLDVGFDPAILNPVDVTFGPFLGDPTLFEALTDFNFATPGIVDFAEVSLLLPSELDALQPSSFSLATLSFTAIADGESPFSLVGDRRIDDAFGAKLLPEPSTEFLFGLGLIGLFALKYREKMTRSY